MQIGVIGINHKLADLSLREKMARHCLFLFGPDRFMSKTLLLSTCNRTEIYFSHHDLSNMQSEILQLLKFSLKEDACFEQKVYSFFGKDCFCHLARVTSGLDSACIAETEIQGQVRKAYDKSTKQIDHPPEIHFLFQKALKVGKHVRTCLLERLKLPSIEQAVFQAGRHFFSTLKEQKILFVGASEINDKIIEHFRNKGLNNISICNRTEKYALPFVKKYGLNHLPWEEFDDWEKYRFVIFGTKANHPLVTQRKTAIKQLIIDLSVPRNVYPPLGRQKHLTLLNIDQLNRMLKLKRRQYQTALINAEAIIEQESLKQVTLFQQKQACEYLIHDFGFEKSPLISRA